jgi:hypothetical protein
MNGTVGLVGGNSAMETRWTCGAEIELQLLNMMSTRTIGQREEEKRKKQKEREKD